MLKGLALDMAEIALKAAGNAILDSILGGLLGGLGGGGSGGPGFEFAKGAVFAPAGSVMARNLKAFARGGIVDTPEAFAFAHGLGIMGEAGPEAILACGSERFQIRFGGSQAQDAGLQRRGEAHVCRREIAEARCP